MKNAVGYIRVSSEKQVKEGGGLEIQKKAIIEFCEKNQIRLLEIFSDEGISGAENLEKRDGLGRCFSYLRKSKEDIECIIVQKLDRLAVDQKFDDDPSGKLMKDIISAFAAFEKNMINIRTMSGKKNKAEKRLFTGGKIPFGYKLVNSDFLQIDEKTAHIVKCIFMLRGRKFSYRKISRYIENVFCISLHFTTIKYILSNKVYIGEFTQEKKYRIPVSPLVTREEFYRINSLADIDDDEDE